MLLLWGHILLHIITFVIMLWLVSSRSISGSRIIGKWHSEIIVTFTSVVRTSASTPHLAREDVVSGRVREDSDDSSTLSFAGSVVDTPIFI